VEHATAGDGVFHIIGTHTYTTEATHLVTFTVMDASSEFNDTTDAGSAVALTQGQNNQLLTLGFGFIPTGGGSVTASTTDISASFVTPGGTATPGSLSVVKFAAAPDAAMLVEHLLANTTNPITDFFDVRASGTVSGSTLTVTFHYTGSGDSTPSVFYYDTTTQQFVSVQGSTRESGSMVIDTTNHTITIIFDSSSIPDIASVGGTVFTIAVAPSTSSQTTTASNSTSTTPTVTTTTSTVDQSTAQALTRGQTTTDSTSSSTVSFSFQSSSKVQLQVNTTQDSARASSSLAADSKTDDKDADTPPDDGKGAKEPNKQDPDRGKKPEDRTKKTEKTGKSDDQPEKPAVSGMKTETNSATPEAQNERKPATQSMPEQEQEQETEAIDAYFAWSAAAVGVAASSIQSRRKTGRAVPTWLR
jgi:hypothetical protein